jgi:hypothetical protein
MNPRPISPPVHLSARFVLCVEDDGHHAVGSPPTENRTGNAGCSLAKASVDHKLISLEFPRRVVHGAMSEPTKRAPGRISVALKTVSGQNSPSLRRALNVCFTPEN